MMDQKTTSRSYPDLPRVAVGAVVLKDNRVLLVRRAKPPAQGLWAIPGGSVELGETLQQAAEREIIEETGITIQAKKPVYTFDLIEKDENNRVRFHYVIVDLMADYISGKPLPGDDADEVRWVSSEELKNLDVNPRTLTVLNSVFVFFSKVSDPSGSIE
jgi:ADP-ribose pyrophosphatase